MQAAFQRVLVTGAAGFLGQYISRWFQDHGASVTEVVRSKRDLPLPGDGSPEAGLMRRSVKRVSVPAETTWPALLQETRPEVIVHCAGSASVPDSLREPGADFEAGPALTFTILDALRVAGSGGRFIFLSSAAVYGNPQSLPIAEDHPLQPLSPYGFHKWQSELLCREFYEIFGVRTAALRIFSAYGAGLRRQVVWDICRQVLYGRPFLLHGTGRESRDFIHASDVAGAVGAVAARAEMRGEIYNIGTGVETTIAELAATLRRVANTDALDVSFDGTATPGNPVNWRADVGRLAALGFQPTLGLEAGLQTVAAWCRQESTAR